MFPYIEIFGRVIGSYAVCSIVGLVVCVAVGTWAAKRYQASFEDVLLCMVVIGVGLIVGAHIMYGITHMGTLAEMLLHITDFSAKEVLATIMQCFGGMVFYGGFIGGAIALKIYVKFAKTPFGKSEVFDIFGMLIPLFHAFGRVGCFLGGCCYGRESTWGFIVHNNTLQPGINGVVRLPIQLIEAGCNLILFLVLLFLFRKRTQEGKLIFVYMLLYPLIRFTTEFFRGDEIRGFLFGLSTSQWVSIILFVIAIYHLFIKKKISFQQNSSNSTKSI